MSIADMGAAVQLMGIIRTLLDPENMLASVNKSEKTDFLNHFYKHCMHGELKRYQLKFNCNIYDLILSVFIAPLLSNTVDSPDKSDSTVQVQVVDLEKKCFFSNMIISRFWDLFWSCSVSLLNIIPITLRTIFYTKVWSLSLIFNCQ